MRLLAIFTLLVMVACVSPPQGPAASAAPPPKEIPASALVDRLGDSVGTAVEVPADAPEDGVRFELDWIYDRIGRFRRLSHGVGQLNGRRYDVLEVETPSGDKHKFYFDITENWKRWTPPQ